MQRAHAAPQVLVRRPHLKSHLLGEVQSGSRLACSKLPVQAAAVQDVLRCGRGDPAACGKKAEAAWHHTSTGHRSVLRGSGSDRDGGHVPSAPVQRAPSRSRGSHPRWAAALERPQRRRLPTFRPSRRGGARTPAAPAGSEEGKSERLLSVLPVPVAGPDPQQGLTWRRPGPPSNTCPCSPQPATGAGPPSSCGGPAPK